MAEADADLARQVRMHDLRGPLTVLTGRVQLLRRRLRRGQPDAERATTDLEAMEAAPVRLAAAVERLERDGLPAR